MHATFPGPSARRRRPTGRAPVRALRAQPAVPRPAPWLLAWLALGIGLCICVPAARGGEGAGATIPFWLIAAPLLNLAWLERARLLKAAAALLQSAARTAGSRRRSRMAVARAPARPRPAPGRLRGAA